MKFVSILFLIIKIINTLNDCSIYDNCFTCSTCGDITLSECNCLWNNNKCESININIRYSKEWWNKFNLCFNDESIELQNKYCGKPQNKKKKIVVEYPEVNLSFGKDNLYCKYHIDWNREENQYIILKIKMGKLLGNNTPLVGITYLYENEFVYHHIYEIGTNIFENYKISNADNIDVHLFSFINYTSNPIEITLDYDKGRKKTNSVLRIIIIILFVLIALVGIFYLFYIYLKKRKKNNNNDNTNNEDEKNNITLSNHEITSEKIRKKCLICQKELFPNNEVITTHKQCLTPKLNNNLKCPHCNVEITNDKNQLENNLSRKNGDNNAAPNFSNFNSNSTQFFRPNDSSIKKNSESQKSKDSNNGFPL